MADRDPSAATASSGTAAPGAPSTFCRSLTQRLDELSWLVPSTQSLAAMARPSGEFAWVGLRHDPAAVLHVVRRLGDAPVPAERLWHGVLADPGVFQAALENLRDAPGFVDWSRPDLSRVYTAAATLAGYAERIARRVAGIDPEWAHVCGLLAPLGWYAIVTVDPSLVTACLRDPQLPRDPGECQHRHWGAEHAALVRRMATRWGLPAWLAATLGNLALPEKLARPLGIHPALFHVTRLAVLLARERGPDLGLLPAESRELLQESRAALGLTAEACAEIDPTPEGGLAEWAAPHGQFLLVELLRNAAHQRRQHNHPALARLERDVDALHEALEAQARDEARRLQAAKLTALAEFAAGAGHEINNPLAVISGQAQYILGHAEWLEGDADGEMRKSLETVITQTRRVHNLLRELMQFARPAPARPEWFDLPTLLGEVAAAVEGQAVEASVRVEVGRTPDAYPVYADPVQVRQAILCLARNGVEAAGPGGWVRLAVGQPSGERAVEVTVEDSGPGPDPKYHEQLFDPFFSGRSAGRGKGLGLPIAWRLLRQQGGDVALVPPAPNRPTCFLVTLPRPVGVAPPARAGANAA